MTGVRPFVRETDLHQVAELHQLVFGNEQRPSQAYLDRHEKYFHEVFFDNPWRDDALPSLVYMDDGRIVGFLGVIPRPMLMNGRPLRVALASQFMVHPQKRGRVGLALARAFFSGPQDLSISEGNGVARTVWEGLGGTTLLLYSIRWTRWLHPSRYVLAFLRRHGVASILASALEPLAVAADRMLEHRGHFHVSPPETTGEELAEDVLLAGLSEVSRRRSCHACYDGRSIKWTLARLADRGDRGRFRKVLVCNGAREAIGWFLYYVNPAGASEVVQVAARGGAIREVLAHLFHDARAQGAVAVTGQLDPAGIQAFSESQCLLHGSGGSWILAHAKRPEPLEAFHRGDAFFTRLEGETWVGF